MEESRQDLQVDTSPPKPRFSPNTIRIMVAIVSIAVVTALRMHSYTEPLEGDDANYMIMAKLWQDGGRPYDDLWDNKPIGTFVVYRVGIALFGYREETPRLMGLIVSAVSTFLLFGLLVKHRLSVMAFALLIVWPVLTVWTPAQANGTNMEVILVPFILAMLLLLERRRATGKDGFWFGAVAVVVISLLIKQVMLPFLAVPFAYLRKDQLLNWRGMLGRCAVLGIAIIVAHLAVYGMLGYSPGYLLNQFAENKRYVTARDQSVFVRVLLGVLKHPFNPAIVWLLPLTTFAAASFVTTWSCQRVLLLPRLALYGAAILSIYLPGGGFAHYFILLLPVLLLLFSDAFDFVCRWRVPAVFLAIAVTAHLGYCTWQRYLKLFPEQISNSKFGGLMAIDRFIGMRMREEGVTDADIWVDGSHPLVFFYSRNMPATRFHCGWTYHLGVTTWEDTFSELREKRPKFIVLTAPRPHPELVKVGFTPWLEANYKERLQVGRYGRTFATVYSLSKNKIGIE